MKENQAFDFGDNSVASAYDEVLLPLLFRPWARQLVETYGPWEGRQVLDLAVGTGAVTEQLAERMGDQGLVIAVDINGEMLERARRRCIGSKTALQFVQSPADALEVPSSVVDYVLCQQGFQFFPDRGAAARELCRVLRPGGAAVATTWRPVKECRYFGAICDALSVIQAPEIENAMRLPFDHLPPSELAACFESAGFTKVQIGKLEQDLVVDQGTTYAIHMAYATPIGPALRALPEIRQQRFQSALKEILNELSEDGTNLGPMVSNVVHATKPPHP